MNGYRDEDPDILSAILAGGAISIRLAAWKMQVTDHYIYHIVTALPDRFDLVHLCGSIGSAVIANSGDDPIQLDLSSPPSPSKERFPLCHAGDGAEYVAVHDHFYVINARDSAYDGAVTLANAIERDILRDFSKRTTRKK